MALLYRKRIITAKIETTYGTDSTPAGAQAILVRNLSITPQEADLAKRDVIRSYLSNAEEIPAAFRVLCEFEVEMAGSGAAGTAPGYDCLLRACGLSATTSAGVSVTYAPISASFESTTIYFNVDGVLHKLTGARGNVSISMKVKEIPTFKFSFTGIYNAVTDTAAVTPVYTSFQTPLTVTNLNTTPFTLLSASPVMSELSLDIGNTIVHRTLVGGSENVMITDREAKGSVTIEANTIATKDWFAAAKAITTGTLSITHGTTGGNKVQITAPKIQVTKPTYSDADGVAMLTMGMNYLPSSGNDEFAIVVL